MNKAGISTHGSDVAVLFRCCLAAVPDLQVEQKGLLGNLHWPIELGHSDAWRFSLIVGSLFASCTGQQRNDCALANAGLANQTELMLHDVECRRNVGMV